MDNDRCNVYSVSVDEGFFTSSYEDGGQGISVLHAQTAKRNTPLAGAPGQQKQTIPNAFVAYKWSFFIEMRMHVYRVKRLAANGRKVMLRFTSISGKMLPSNIHGSLLSM